MSKTKAVKSIKNKAPTKKVKNIDKEMVEKDESNQLAVKAEKKIKTVAKEVNEKIISKDTASLNASSRAVDSHADEIAQAALSTNDIESSNGKKK